jgi:hypothetical protein
MPDSISIEPGSIFSLGQIDDRSGFVFPPEEDDSLVLADAMGEALSKALEKRLVLGEGQYTVNVAILEYEPGNAFARWLLPGAGKTRLSVVASVVGPDGASAAKIPVERSIGFGGGYTIGAWRYVFDEVAEVIADLLVDTGKRTTK